jgi:hypothetical protein
MLFIERETYYLDALYLVCGLPVLGVAMGTVFAGPIGAVAGVALGIGLGLLGAELSFRIYMYRAKQSYIAGRATEQLLTELRGPAPEAPWVLLEELRARGHDMILELDLVCGMLASADASERDEGSRALRAGYPELDLDVSSPPTDSSSGTPSGSPPAPPRLPSGTRCRSRRAGRPPSGGP